MEHERHAWRETIAESFGRLQLAARAIVNPLTYAFRQRLKFQRKGYAETPESLSAWSPRSREKLVGARAKQLEHQYALEWLKPRLRHDTYWATLYFCDQFDLVFERSKLLLPLPSTLRILDLGAKNFESALALYHVFRHAKTVEPRTAHLTGIEIDAYPIYQGLHSRFDVAHYYLSLLPQPNSADPHRYLAMDMLDHHETYDVITWSHPFLYAAPLLHWGLPRRLLKPKAMFDRMLTLLKPDGVAIIVNQLKYENELQLELLEYSGLEFESFETELEFSERDDPSYIHALRNRPAKLT